MVFIRCELGKTFLSHICYRRILHKNNNYKKTLYKIYIFHFVVYLVDSLDLCLSVCLCPGNAYLICCSFI